MLLRLGMRIGSNQMLLNFGRTRSLDVSKHEIGDSRTPSSGRIVATHRRTRFGHLSFSVLRLIDTRRDSPNSHYVNPSTRGSPRMPKDAELAALLYLLYRSRLK